MTKLKKILLCSAMSVFALSCSAVAMSQIGKSNEAVIAQAATTAKYTQAFDWDYKYVYATGGGSSTTTDSGTDSYSATFTARPIRERAIMRTVVRSIPTSSIFKHRRVFP